MEILYSSHLLINLHKTRSSHTRSFSSSTTNRNKIINLSANNYLRNSTIFLNNSLAWSNIKRKTYMGAVFAKQGDNIVKSSAATPGPSAENWKKWLVGVIMSIALPFASKWGRLLAIKNQVETVVNTVETVVETVEKVAEEVAHVADEVANQLPEGGKLQSIACVVANVAEETAKDAHLIDQFIEKVEDVEEKVGSVIVGEVHEIVTEVQLLDEVSNGDNTQESVEKLANKPEIIHNNMQENRDYLNNNNQPDK